MSQNEGASSSSATRPSQNSDGPPELSEEQKRTVEKCTGIVQEFRTGSISKPKASWLLQQAIPRSDDSEERFLSDYEPYFDMLDNFERYQQGNVGRFDDVHQRLTGHLANDGQDVTDEQRVTAGPVGTSKRPRSPESDTGEDEYTRRTRLDYDTLPWNEPEDSIFGPSSTLSPELQKTQSLLENFSRDAKRARTSLLNCNRPIPQFPPAEWLNLLSGNAVDLDHVLSNIYTISHSTSEVVELGKNLELLHGSSAPAKSVRTHGDWVIAWDSLVDATLFVFKHRRSELQAYGKHIQRYFASLPAQMHGRIINYDRAARIRAAQRRDIELSNFSEFADLQIQWINNPSSAAPSGPSTESKEPKEPSGKNKKGRRSAACRRWNEGRCPNAAACCNYLHVCSKCANPGHVAGNCDSPAKK
jgi:hypothetical protein